MLRGFQRRSAWLNVGRRRSAPLSVAPFRSASFRDGPPRHPRPTASVSVQHRSTSLRVAQRRPTPFGDGAPRPWPPMSSRSVLRRSAPLDVAKRRSEPLCVALQRPSSLTVVWRRSASLNIAWEAKKEPVPLLTGGCPPGGTRNVAHDMRVCVACRSAGGKRRRSRRASMRSRTNKLQGERARPRTQPMYATTL